METEAETLESISTMKLKEEVKDLHCSQLDATTNEASIREIQKNEDQHLSPPATVENSIKAETEVATDKGIVYHVLEGNDGSLESEMFLESPSNANIAIDESYRTSDDCKDKEKPILVKNEQDKVMQLENYAVEAKHHIPETAEIDAVEAKHHIPETAEIDALGKQNSTATSLNNGGTEYKELAEPSELPAEGNNVKDYMVDKLPSLPITSTLVNLSVQEGKLKGGEGEVMEESKQMSGNLFNDKKNPMENVQEDACLVEKSDEQMPEAICASQSIKKEKAVSGSQKDEVEDKSSGEDPLIESGIGQTIGATPDHNHEASLVPAPIKESLINDDRSEEATKIPQMSIDKSMEVVACDGGESLYKNTESIPIEQQLGKTNLQEEEIEGKEQDTSSNLLIVEKGPESIIQTEEIENEKKEGDENQQASLSNTCISTATTSPGIQNGEADNLEDEKSTSNKFEIPSFTTITEEENSQKAKQEESGILEYASSFTLEAKKDAEKLKEEASQRHETTNSNEYIDKQIIQEEEVINDQSAVSSGEEIIKCTQEDEEERHDVEVSEGLEVAGTSNDSEAKIMEAEDVEEHSTGKQEDIEEARKPEKEMTMETDTNILSEIHQKTATEDDGTIQQYSKVSDGEGTVKDNSQEDKKKAKDPVEVFEGLETAGANEDTEQKIVEDGVFRNHSNESIGEQTIKESEVQERLEGAGDATTEEQITDEEVSFIDLSTRSVGEEATNWSSQEDEVFKAHETTSAGEDTGSVTLPDICGDTGAITLPDICAVAVGEVTSNEDSQENEKNAKVHGEVKETNPTHSTQRPSTSIATEASEDIHKKRNEQLVGSSLLVSEDHIEGKSVEKAEITSDKLETESVTLVTEKTSLHQAGQEDMKLSVPSSLPSEEMSAGTTDFQALHVEEVKLVEHTKLDENANDAILTTGEPDANKADDDIKYDMIERACATESESEHHGIEITASETPKDEEEDKLFESSTSASKQPEPEIVEAQENIKDETLMEEKNQGEKEETPTVVQEKEENFTQKEEISKIEETSKKEPEDIGKETAVEELKKQEPFEYKDAHKTVEKTCIENFEQETAGEIENTSGFETQEKSIDINKSDKEINDEYAKEDEIQNKIKIDISEIVESRDEEVQEQSTEKDGSEVEAKEICINMVSERVDTAASSSVAAKDTSDNIEGAVENLQGFVEEKEGAETSEIDSTRETGHKIEVEDFTNLEVLQQNIKQVDSCEKIQSTEIEISYKHHDESSASTDKPGEEIDEYNDPEEAHQVIEASKVSRSEAATSEHEASGSKQTSEMECVKLEKTGDLDLKEEEHYIDTKEVTTSQEEILDKHLCKSETEGVNTEERIRDKDSAAEDIIAVSLANEIAGQSCQEDETEEQQIAKPAPELRVEDLLHRTSDADDTTMNGTQDEEVYEGCKTGDSGESKEKQLKEEICTVKNVSVVSIEEEIIDESSRAENPKEVDTSSNMQVLEGLETVNADEHTEKQIIKKDGAANDKHTVAVGEETVKESFQKDGEIAEKREVECEDSSITHLSEGLQEGRPSEDTSEQMIEENDDANDNSTVYAGKEEHKDGIHTSDIPNGEETIMENPHKEEEETNKQEGEIKESKLIPEELSFEPTVSAAKTITVIEVSEEKQHIDNSEKLNETASLLSEVSKEQVEEEILQQPDKTNKKLMETGNITLLESELDTTDLVDSIDLPSAKMSPSCPENVEARVTTLQALDVEDIKLEEISSIIMETEKVSLQESELKTTNLVDATDIPSGEMSPDCPANAEASVTTLQALDVEDIKLGETSSITMETEKISLHESEQQTMNLVDASNIPSREMSPGCLANAEASVTTLKALDVEDIKPGETSSITMETENISVHESEQETMNLVNATNIPYGEMGTGCPANAEASATTLQALDVEDIKLTETSSITMETETISLHESEQEITDVDSADLHSGEISPGGPANLEASATNLHALDVEDMKIEETSSIAKVGLDESELGPTDLVYSTDPPSGEMSPGCSGNVEASVTTLKALDVEAMKLKETSLVTMETEKISLHASELENLLDTTDIPSGKMGPGCPANVEASATILQALDVEDMRLEGTSSITKEQEKVSIHGSELEPTNLVDSTDLPSGEMSPGCPASLEASATTIHALDLEDMKLEETSSIAKVNLHESELEPPNLVDSTDPPFGEMSPVCLGNVEASATILDVECMKLEETSNLNDNANEEILAAIKPDAAEAEGLKYNIMLEDASGTVLEDEEQGTEAEITTKICSDDEGEETLQDSSTPKPQVLDSIETQEKITDQIPVEIETQYEKLEIHPVAQKEEEMPMQQEEKAGKVEEDTKMGSEGMENEYLNEHQNREGETTDKSLELNPEKHILEKEIVKPTQSSEHSKTEGSQPESEKVKSGGEKKFDELAEESESTGTCAYVEKDITDEGRNENMKVENEVVESEVEDHSHEKNEVSNATMKGTMIENPEAVDPTKKLTGTSESDAENQNYATFIETEKIETGEERNNISISVEDQIVGKNFQEENKKREYLEEAGHKLENEDQSGKINYVNEISQGFILDAEVLHEDERPEESDKIQKLYTASVNDEAVKEVKATDLVSLKQNFQVIYSSEKTETESPMDEKDWNKSIVSPITKDLDNELPKIEGSSMLETPSVMDATEERSSEEVEQPKNVVASSIAFEEKSLQTVKTTETSEMDDEVKSVNLEERFASVCKLPTFEDENRNQESLTREKMDRDKVEEEIREELVVASDAAPQSEGPVKYANPESDTATVGSLTVTAEEPEQKGQQSSKLEYGEQQLEIPVMGMVKDNPMIEDVPQNMKNAEIETTSDQNVEANNSEARELGVFAANKERKGEVPIEGETQDTKVGVPSVPKMIERRFSHTEEECKELKASETGSEYTEKEMQHAEHMKEENLEISPGLICSKTDSESTNAASLLEKEIEKTEELTETTEDSGKETVKVNKATETGLREDEQIQGYKKSIDGVLQEPETVGASAPGKDVLENSDILENENLEEENSEATSQVEKIGTVESKNTPKNEDDSPNTNALAEETLAGEADGECGDATNVEPEKLIEALESVSEAQIHDMQNETKTSQNSEGGTAVKDLDTVSGGDDRIGERIQEDKMGDDNVSEAIPKFETAENHNEKTSEANNPLGNEFAVEEVIQNVNVEKKIKEEEEAVHPGQVYVRKTVKDEEYEEKGKEVEDEIKLDLEEQSHDFKAHEMQSEKTYEGNENTGKKCANQEVVFEGSAQKPDLKFVGEETSKDDHHEGENGEKFGDGVNPSYPTIEGIGEHIKDEAPVEEILQKETKKKLYEDIVQDGVCEGENTNIQIPRQEETQIFLTDKRETAERSITASLDELDNTSNMVVEEQSQVKTDFKSGTQVNGNDETKESTKIEDADNLNENMKDMSHTQPLGKEILDKQDSTKLASVAGIEKSTNTTAEEQTPQEVDFTESTEEEISTGSTDISPMPMEPIEKTLSKAQEKVQKPGQTSEIESEVKEVECGLEESTDEPKPSDLDKASLSDHFQKSIKETLETVGRSGDERESKVNKKSLENKGALNIQVEEEKTDEGEDKPDQEDEEEHKKGDSGSDAPVMVEASRDVEVKPAHKKSHNILSGVGSKVKHSIAKVKKAITGKSSHHKQSSPKQESESTLTVKAAADPNL